MFNLVTSFEHNAVVIDFFPYVGCMSIVPPIRHYRPFFFEEYGRHFDIAVMKIFQ